MTPALRRTHDVPDPQAPGAAVRAGFLVGGVVLLTAAAPATATWKLSNPRIPQVHNGSLAAESCPGTADCIAVGNADGPYGPARTLAEAWNGTAWRVLPTPEPAGSKGSNLDAVSCPAATACTAVGTYVNSSGTALPLAEAWNGATWSIQATPDQSGSHGTVLDGVSCTGPSACTAVGYFLRRGISGTHTLAETWNGSAWALQQTPNPGGHDDVLAAVSCTTPSACTAVGSKAVGEPAGVAEAWNGSTWTTQTTPAPAGAITRPFTGVSCAAGTCFAVGYSHTRSGTTRVVAEARTGTTWALQSAANPLGAAYSSLAGVSCTSAASCIAVGTSTAQGWNGSRWRDLFAARPHGATSIGLTDVSCATATACMAVGFYSTATGGGLLAESWNGTAWTIRPPASPTGATGASLNGVSCTAAGSCAAVGHLGAGALAETWNGTTWAAGRPPGPANSVDVFLNRVSCVTASGCTAVGDYSELNTGFGLTLAEVWNGAAWHIQQTVSPGNTEIVALTGISCTANGACTAVGGYGPSEPNLGVEVPLAEQRN
jgi:hypothetical protein